MGNCGLCGFILVGVFAHLCCVIFNLYGSCQENKWMKQCLEEEQKSRKELERVVRKLAKQKNDCAWEDGDH